MLELLNLKCDKILTKVVELDQKTYEIIDVIKNENDNGHNVLDNSESNGVWDYYDLQTTKLSNIVS